MYRKIRHMIQKLQFMKKAELSGGTGLLLVRLLAVALS